MMMPSFLNLLDTLLSAVAACSLGLPLTMTTVKSLIVYKDRVQSRLSFGVGAETPNS